MLGFGHRKTERSDDKKINQRKLLIRVKGEDNDDGYEGNLLTNAQGISLPNSPLESQ